MTGSRYVWWEGPIRVKVFTKSNKWSEGILRNVKYRVENISEWKGLRGDSVSRNSKYSVGPLQIPRTRNQGAYGIQSFNGAQLVLEEPRLAGWLNMFPGARNMVSVQTRGLSIQTSSPGAYGGAVLGVAR